MMSPLLLIIFLVLQTTALPSTQDPLPPDGQSLALAYKRSMPSPASNDEEPVTPPRDPLYVGREVARLNIIDRILIALAYVPIGAREIARHNIMDRILSYFAYVPNYAREAARLRIMENILTALGPPFREELPRPPTNDIFAMLPTITQFNVEPCPDRYKRCSSQAYYPSCEVPHRMDADIWPHQFNLYFDLSRVITTRVDVINATLRLYKRTSLLLETPTTLLIKVFCYVKRLNRRRRMHRIVVSTQVASDFIGWVTLPVEPMLQRWRRRRMNHGLLITVRDEDNRLWDANRIFIPMDCDISNDFLLPLPFEVQINLEGEGYPALDIRLGSLKD